VALSKSAQLDLRLGLETPSAGGINIVFPNYVEEPLHLAKSDEAFSKLGQLDWSFTDDETRFLTHDIHPYPAKYIPQIPGNLIARLSSRGELVLDPFGGSGTTALEAIRLGRRALSIDANPVATLIGKVKTARLDRRALDELQILHSSLSTELSSSTREPSVLLKKYQDYIPPIPNREKWFPDSSTSELVLIRYRIDQLESDSARDIALLTLSRIVLRVSFQDSETRYKSIKRNIPRGYTLRLYIKELEDSIESVGKTAAAIRYGVSDFLTSDIRSINPETLRDNSVDLVVTSPPYGNATDYHLYHRFRLFWLGYDPTKIGQVEIGSHLKHQRESSGFESYLDDLVTAVRAINRVLKPGRYAALVIGDSLYNGKVYKTAELLNNAVDGFDAYKIIERKIHRTKRSFAAPARRASSEKILLLRKSHRPTRIVLHAAPYKLWPYEESLKSREITKIAPRATVSRGMSNTPVVADPTQFSEMRKLVFTHTVEFPGGYREPTWQAIVENGMAANGGARKDPKYATHGIHPYKGKFYPQLGKGLINLTDLKEGAAILDPFCGCGTTLLESYINGYRGYGIDMNPLAAKIAKVKVGILDTNPDIFREATQALISSLKRAPTDPRIRTSEFDPACLDEIDRWFPAPVIGKLNWTLRTIRRVSAGIVRDFFEVVLSSIIRDISQQEPSDLRIRYREKLLKDADVYGEFLKQLEIQATRIEKFWSVRGYAPCHFYPATVVEGDCRTTDAFTRLGVHEGFFDLVLTSPPYATALPYIDTDRLSLLTILGLTSSQRRPLEHTLIGSREIGVQQRKEFEDTILASEELPPEITDFLTKLVSQLKQAGGGFRKQNMPALLQRFFMDMKKVVSNCRTYLKNGGEAMIIIGDNRMNVGDKEKLIPTVDFVELISNKSGFKTIERINISVTTENLLHMKNSITQNVVLRLRKHDSQSKR